MFVSVSLPIPRHSQYTHAVNSASRNVSPQATGYIPFHLSFMNFAKSVFARSVQPCALLRSPAARHAQSSPWHVPMPTRVRLRRSTRLWTSRLSMAFCTSLSGTSSHSHTRLCSFLVLNWIFAAMLPARPAVAFWTVDGLVHIFCDTS